MKIEISPGPARVSQRVPACSMKGETRVPHANRPKSLRKIRRYRPLSTPFTPYFTIKSRERGREATARSKGGPAPGPGGAATRSPKDQRPTSNTLGISPTHRTFRPKYTHAHYAPSAYSAYKSALNTPAQSCINNFNSSIPNRMPVSTHAYSQNSCNLHSARSSFLILNMDLASLLLMPPVTCR